MSKLNQLTDDEIRELLRKPLSDENAKQLAEIDKQDSWLLALNLREMDREAADPNYDPAQHPFCVRITFESDEE